MSDEELRERLRQEFVSLGLTPGDGYYADALLPVVRAYAAEALREAAGRVQAVYDLQCPVEAPSRYMPGAYHAHRWWQTVLGSALDELRDRADALAPADTPEAHRG